MAPGKDAPAAMGPPRPRDRRRLVMKDLEVLSDQDEELEIPLPFATKAQMYAKAHTDTLISHITRQPALIEGLYRRLILHEELLPAERAKIDRIMVYAQDETEAAFIINMAPTPQGRVPSDNEMSVTSEPLDIGDTEGKLFVSDYDFYITFSLTLAVHTPSTAESTDVAAKVYCSLHSVLASGESVNLIQLAQPMGDPQKPLPYKWSISRDYNVKLNPSDDEYVQTSNSPTLRKTEFAGFKFISPMMNMRHRKMFVDEVNRFFNTLRAAENKLVIHGSDTCYFHVHVKALSSDNVDLAIRFTSMYLLLEQLISGFIPRRKWADPMLCASMLELHESPRFSQGHVSNSTGLIERFFNCKSVAEVAHLFNPAQPGHVYQTPLPESVRSHVRGTVDVRGPTMENFSFSKYYKVNLGYALFNYGTLEFREHPAGLTEEDAFRWIDLCLRLVTAASELDKTDLLNIAKIRDLGQGGVRNDDYMFLVFCSILASKQLVRESEEFDAALGACWYWYKKLQKEEETRWGADINEVVGTTPQKGEEGLVTEIEERWAKRQVYVHPKAAIERTLSVGYKVLLPLLLRQLKSMHQKIDN